MTVFFALLAAALYALNVPLAKFFVQTVSPAMMAGFLYLGAGVGMGLWILGKKCCKIPSSAPPLDKKDLPYTVVMVVLATALMVWDTLGDVVKKPKKCDEKRSNQ